MMLGVTVGSRYAEVLLLRGKSRNVAVVAVEGTSDSRAYRRVLSGSAHVVWLNGKDAVLELLDRFKRTTVTGAVGIVDADYDRLFQRKRQEPAVCWTSHTDLESMVLSSDAYLLATENGLDEKERRKHRDLLLLAAVPVGCLRAASSRKQLALDFKSIRFEAFIDTGRITCDRVAVCEEILRSNLQCSLSLSDLVDLMDEMCTLFTDPWQVVNGHDLCRIAQICSLRIFGRTIATPKSVFDSIVGHYSLSTFENCSTYEELRQWQDLNSGFEVLVLEPSIPQDTPD